MDELELDDIQGLLRHGYPYFDSAAYCLFDIGNAAVGARQWLRTLIDPAEPWIDGAHLHFERLRFDYCSVAIAFTAHGLQTLGLGAEDLQTFVTEFQEGIATENRSRLLGDVSASRPEDWLWRDRPGIDGLLIVFAARGDLDARVAEVERIQGCPQIFRRLTGRYEQDRTVGIAREPFGFADGLSQPHVEGLTRKPAPPGVRAVKAGEFVLGYRNEIGRFPASPSVGRDPEGILPRQGTSDRGDFGRNGSFLVMRQLEQHVADFERFVGRNEQLAARLVGRWRSGAPLVQHPDEDAPGMTQRELEARNGFGYHREDRHGLRCPIGAHIRRANPRDSLADGLGIPRLEAQALADQHRILRRGRVYEEAGRTGLVFVCLNANLERQFEFVQGSWVMNPEFGGLSGETDPLLGNAGPAHAFTVQRTLLGERCEGLAQFVTVRGGGYFFLPGLRALDYLSR